jgi:bla regulator protein blaR1
VTFANLSPLENHLWQSTLCVVLVWLLTLALKRNRAAIRYWLWFAASVKFLIPFSLFVSIGSQLGWRAAPAVAQPQWPVVIGDFGHPFAGSVPTAPTVTPVSHSIPAIPIVLFGIWLCGVAVSITFWLLSWRKVRSAQREATPVALALPIPAMSTRSLVEPGVFGIFRPMLLLPEGITDRLTPAQLDAIVTHEMCHVRRRDNLTGAIHMAIEALFWFHPLIWWIGARLIEERERACDEEVIELGSEPSLYAESILKTCEFCVESSLACVSGITGADLRERIARIMTEGVARKLDFRRKLLLGMTGFAALVVPVVSGMANTAESRAEPQTEDIGRNGSLIAQSTPGQMRPIQSPHVDAQSDRKGEAEFDVASIRVNKSHDVGGRFAFTGDGFYATNISVIMLLKLAYGVEEDQIVGLPRWGKSERFDIAAKVLGKDSRKLSIEQCKHMIRPLLADRFQLRFHEVEKNVAVYTLVISKNGSKLRPSKPDSCSPLTEHGQTLRMMGRGYVLGLCIPMELITQMLVDQLGRPVIDRTGLKGDFDFRLHWTPDEEVPFRGQEVSPQENTGPDSDWPTLSTAVNEQLGLRLKGEKGPAGAIAIDHLEEPSAN